MSKFNSTTAKKTKTTNLAGGEAYSESQELELVSALLTSFLGDKYYETGKTRQTRIEELVAKVDQLFAAKASIYARNEFGLRSVSHVVAGQIAGVVKGEEWTKRYFDKIVYRPDDMMEILSYYYSNFTHTEPNALKKGFAKAFSRFDEYQLAKYRANTKALKLVDIVNLVHPRHNEAIAKLVKDELRNKKTFEAKISQAGQDKQKDSKSKAWADLINENTIGYFALLRNLRNILKEVDEDTLDKALETLTNENRIKKSLILPFQFVTAYSQLESARESSKVLGAISQALDISLNNVPEFKGKTLVVIDHSGSMGSGFDSEFGRGAIFGLALAKRSGADLMHFGDVAKYLSINPADSTVTLFKGLNSLNSGYGWNNTSGNNVGHGTNFNSIFEEANKAYDRIIIISDMQAWVGYNTPNKAFASYKQKYNADPFIYSWDISGYGSLQFPENNVVALTGWSEKIFDLMKVAEQDKKALITKINSIEV